MRHIYENSANPLQQHIHPTPTRSLFVGAQVHMPRYVGILIFVDILTIDEREVCMYRVFASELIIRDYDINMCIERSK